MKKSNVFIQRDYSSCGACSIQSIVSFYGGYIPLGVAMEDTHTTSSGTNAFFIVNALKKYGFDSFGISCSLDEINSNMLPAIAHTIKEGLEHFLVIYEIRDNYILVMDPEVGEKKCKIDDFKRFYDDKLIIAHPIGKVVQMERKTTLKEVLVYLLKTDARKLIFLSILNIIFATIGVTIGLYVKIALSNRKTNAVLCVFIALCIFKLIIYLTRNKISAKMTIKYRSRLRELFLKHIFNLDLSFLEGKRLGEILQKIEDATYIGDWYLNLILDGSLNLIILLLSFFACLLINPLLAMFGVMLYIIFIFISFYVADKLYKREKIMIIDKNRHSADMCEYLDGIESIKNLNRESEMLDNLSVSRSIANKSEYLTENTEINCFAVKNLLMDIGFVFIMTIGISLFKDGTIQLDDFIAFSSMFSLGLESISSITSFIPGYIHTKTIFSNISEFLDIKSVKCGKYAIEDINEIDIENLKYSSDSYHCVLNGISSKIFKGDKILVRGASGAGKSTLARCICKSISGFDGKIYINGINISLIDNKYLRRRIIYVSQNEKLFSMTIKDNIVFSRPFDQNLYDFAVKVPKIDKLFKDKCYLDDTYLVEAGNNLSGGERARIILARALYSNPSVLIIDETLSSIDEDDENEILESLLEFENLTLIYITHRDKEKYFNKILTLGKEGYYEVRNK